MRLPNLFQCFLIFFLEEILLVKGNNLNCTELQQMTLLATYIPLKGNICCNILESQTAQDCVQIDFGHPAPGWVFRSVLDWEYRACEMPRPSSGHCNTGLFGGYFITFLLASSFKSAIQSLS